jgi:hypothetical protein
MLSVTWWSSVPTEPGTAIIQVWQTGNEARDPSQALAIGAASLIRLSSE